MKFFLHLGAHKTATTFIQRNLRANKKWFAADGWTFVHLKWHYPKVHEAVLKMRKLTGATPKLMAPYRKLFSDLRKTRTNIFFTTEDIIGTMSVMDSGEIYPLHALNIDRLQRALGGVPVDVAFSIREYGAYIESSYHWYVSRGTLASFETYVAKVDPEKISWLGIVAKLIDTFGIDHVRIWTFEDFRRAPDAYIARLVELAGIDAAGRLKVPQTDPVNVAYSEETLPMAMAWNDVLQDTKLLHSRKRELRERMRELLGKVTPVAKLVKPKLLSDAMREQLAQKYQRDLEELRRRWPSVILDVPSAAASQAEPVPAAV